MNKQPPVEEEEFVDLEPDPELFGTDDLIGIDELAVLDDEQQ